VLDPETPLRMNLWQRTVASRDVRQPQSGQLDASSRHIESLHLTSNHGKQRLRCRRRCRSRGMQLSKSRRKPQTSQSLSTRHGKLTSSQGDLGHTDLQEDLEFHSSSKLSIDLLLLQHHPNPATNESRSRLRNPTLWPWRPQDPTRLVIRLLPPRPRRLLLQQPHIAKALSLVAQLLRPSLRRRHRRSPPPLHLNHLPTRQLPRCARRESRSLRPCMDRYNRRCHLVLDGDD
jgi:hypothetical protein